MVLFAWILPAVHRTHGLLLTKFWFRLVWVNQPPTPETKPKCIWVQTLNSKTQPTFLKPNQPINSIWFSSDFGLTRTNDNLIICLPSIIEQDPSDGLVPEDLRDEQNRLWSSTLAYVSSSKKTRPRACNQVGPFFHDNFLGSESASIDDLLNSYNIWRAS